MYEIIFMWFYEKTYTYKINNKRSKNNITYNVQVEIK